MRRPAPIIRLVWAITRDRNRLSKRLRDAIYERDRAMDVVADLRRDIAVYERQIACLMEFTPSDLRDMHA